MEPASSQATLRCCLCATDELLMCSADSTFVCHVHTSTNERISTLPDLLQCKLIQPFQQHACVCSLVEVMLAQAAVDCSKSDDVSAFTIFCCSTYSASSGMNAVHGYCTVLYVQPMLHERARCFCSFQHCCCGTQFTNPTGGDPACMAGPNSCSLQLYSCAL